MSMCNDEVRVMKVNINSRIALQKNTNNEHQ